MLKFVRPTLLSLLIAGIIPGLGTSTAMALAINFTDGSWNGAHGQASYTVGNVKVEATGGKISVNYDGGPSGDSSGNDGLGIGTDDEITQGGAEVLTISFAGPVTLESVYITDLYKFDFGFLNLQHEKGWYRIDDESPISFTQNTIFNNSNGELTLNLNASDVNAITFWSNNDRGSDYSVKGLKYSVVPEPSTLLLLGFGFIVAATLYRRGYFPSV